MSSRTSPLRPPPEYLLLTPLPVLPSLRRRDPARSNNSPPKPRMSALAVRRLSVLPELDEREPSSSRPSSPPALLLPSPATSPNPKRLSRYGKASMLAPSADDLTFERPRPAPRPPASVAAPTPKPSKRLTVRLSAFDFEIPAKLPEASDAVAFPAPPSPTLSSASDVDVPCPTTAVRLSAFPFDLPADFARPPSPASSLSSDDTATSDDLPLTPTSDDDEWPASGYTCAVPIRPLVINKTAPRFPPVEHDEHEDDATWYARELGARFALAAHEPSPLAA
ncbi:hypothetical protein K488DRAFT_91624, partial [Vararia minispora EC-137]